MGCTLLYTQWLGEGLTAKAVSGIVRSEALSGDRRTLEERPALLEYCMLSG